MLKSVFSIISASILVLTLFSGCKKEPVTSSSSFISSDTASNSVAYPEMEISQDKIIRLFFVSNDSNGNVFYCSADGTIFKKVPETNGLSKIYSSNEYKFFSVQCFNDNEICVGYKKGDIKSGFMIFNLKDKTVKNAITLSKFADSNVYSLVFYKNIAYFLANPDRYNRYTLYKQENGEVYELARGVNEFFILENRIYYNIGNKIYWTSPNRINSDLFAELDTNDLLGFTIIGDNILYMTSVETFLHNKNTGIDKRISENLNVYTHTQNKDNAFFVGVNGGIYMYSFSSNDVEKISEYTSSQIYADNEWIYFYPTESFEFLITPPEYVVSDSIHRISLQGLYDYLKYNKEVTNSSSLANTENESALTSSSISKIDIPIPEKFGI